MNFSDQAPLPAWVDLVVLPALNLVLALLATAGMLAAAGHDPVLALTLLLRGAFGDAVGLGYTLYYATSFVATGLAVSLALHAGLFNIGAEGQAMIGGLLGGLVCLGLGHVASPWVVLPLAGLVSAAGSAAWAVVPAWMLARRGSHIVITTIMFNFIASSVLVWALVNVLRSPAALAVESAPFGPAAQLPSLRAMLAPLGIDLPDSPLNASVFLVLIAAAAVWVLVWHMPLGHALRTLGSSPGAARYAGLSRLKLSCLAMGLSGALASLVAVNELSGVHHKLLLDFTGGAGFVGIAVALLGRRHPLGVVIAAVLFGALYQGGAELAMEMPGVTRDIVVSLQGLVVLFCGALALMLRPALVRLVQLIKVPKRHSPRTTHD